MPPAYVNVGAFVGEGTHDRLPRARGLVRAGGRSGCTSRRRRQIGGVLEPVGALPVIVEDEVLVGGNCGVYEGDHRGPPRRPRRGGDPDRGSMTVYDLPRKTTYRRTGARPPAHPRGGGGGAGLAAAGRRPSRSGSASSLYTPVIVKYRDEKTEASVALEDALR